MHEQEFRLALHQKLCEAADILLFHHNPCRMQGNTCLAGDPNPCCIRTRFKRWDLGDKRCRFIGERGCEFPNIECKVWLCSLAKDQASRECLSALQSLENIAKLYGLTNEQ